MPQRHVFHLSRWNRRRWNHCRIVTFIFTFFYITNLVIIVTMRKTPHSFLPLPVKDNNNAAFLNTSIIENVVLNTNMCDNSTLGIPFSITESTGNGNNSFPNITCDQLLAGDRLAAMAARNFERRSLSDSAVYDLASDCASLKLLGGYQMSPVRSTDADFPIAFTVLLHTSAEQFERLLRAIYRPQNIYCIFVDKKSPAMLHSAVKAIANCFDNVFLASRLYTVVYSGPSRLQVDIDCMKDHLAHTVQWQYVINVPGQAYPLRTPEEMVDILRIYNGTNDIEGIYKRQYRQRYLRQYEEWFANGTSGIRQTALKNDLPPHDLAIVRGSAYGLFSRKFVEFVLTDQWAKDLLAWSWHTMTPDEHYWATLHHTGVNPQLRTPGAYSGTPEKKEFMAVFVKWSMSRKRDERICAGKYVRWVCVLGVGDLPDLPRRREFFVNKFYVDYQPLAFECAERWLHRRVHCPADFNIDFYRRLSFVVDSKH